MINVRESKDSPFFKRLWKKKNLRDSDFAKETEENK